MKQENQSLINKNLNLINENESLIKEKNNNNKIISSYKETIDKLNNEISSLKEIIENYKKEIEALKNKLNIENANDKSKSNNNSLYEDEIVIVNKETTYSKGYGNDLKKSGEFKHNYEVKKNVNLNESEIMKYHEIIQDLSNMILIYENLFFKKDVKPKNNKELFTYLIVQYINNKFKKIKLNALINLIIHKESLPKKIKDKNITSTWSTNGVNDIKTDSGWSDRNKRAYISGRNKPKTDNNE